MVKSVLTLWREGQINEEESRLLRLSSQEVATPLTEEDRRDIQSLAESFIAMNDALGLAAPQIGINKRIIAFRTRGLEDDHWTKEPGSWLILVNPRITQTRGELEVKTEGCLSCPELQVEVPRFPQIKVRAHDAEGRKLSIRYEGFLARVVQHEIDHLAGRLITDYEGPMHFPRKYENLLRNLFERPRGFSHLPSSGIHHEQ